MDGHASVCVRSVYRPAFYSLSPHFTNYINVPTSFFLTIKAVIYPGQFGEMLPKGEDFPRIRSWKMQSMTQHPIVSSLATKRPEPR